MKKNGEICLITIVIDQKSPKVFKTPKKRGRNDQKKVIKTPPNSSKPTILHRLLDATLRPTSKIRGAYSLRSLTAPLVFSVGFGNIFILSSFLRALPRPYSRTFPPCVPRGYKSFPSVPATTLQNIPRPSHDTTLPIPNGYPPDSST